MKQQYLDCAEVINIHGFDGTLKLRHRCDGPETLTSLKTVYRKQGEKYVPFAVTKASVFKDFVLMHLKGVDDENTANAMRGEVLYLDRADLHLGKNAHLIVDLIGLDVFHADTGEKLGRLVDVDTSGVQEYYVVENATGRHLVPNVPAFITAVDEEKGIVMRPIDGLLEG